MSQDTDLAVVEFTFNDAEAAPYTDAARRGFERLLRSLARLPRRPAVIVVCRWACLVQPWQRRRRLWR